MSVFGDKSSRDGFDPRSEYFDWKDLADIFDPDNPFIFFIHVKEVSKSEHYDNYRIRGTVLVREADHTEKYPIEPETETEIGFFTKTSFDTRLKNLFEDDWPNVIIGKVLYVNYQGKQKSKKSGRMFHSFFISEFKGEEQLVLETA